MFKSVFIEEKTIDSMWFKLLYEVYKNGRVNNIDTGSFAGSNRLEFDFVAGTIEFPTTRPLSPIMPDGVPPVTTDEDIEKYFINYIMDGSLEGNEHYKYATWISGGKYKLPYNNIDFKSFDDESSILPTDDCEIVMIVPNQVQWCIDHYKKRGYGSNHCYIAIGYPESNFAYDIPYTSEFDRQTSPCLRGIDTHIKDNILHMAVIFRSWDLYGAWPENIGGITLLGEYIANELGIKMGTLSFSCLKLHVYDHAINALKARLGIN